MRFNAMIKHFFESILNVSVPELPRLSYSWLLRFFVKFGFIIGWTAVVSVTVTRFSIGFLPILFLIQALFTVAGTLLFSVVIEKLSSKNVIVVSTVCALIAISIAFLFYKNSTLFIVFSLIGSGVFLPQINISLSSYLEDYYTPLEAERIVPIVESSETIGGILGGILLVTLKFSMMGNMLMFFWIISMVCFLSLIKIGHPELPAHLKKIFKDSSDKYSDKLSFNGIIKSITEIRRIPFLQILLTVLIFHWVIANFLEFLYTKAVDESVHTALNSEEHQVSLAHGLGTLHVFFHSCALIVEVFVTSRFVKNLGIFAGFVLHGVMTLLSAFTLLFGFGYFTAVFAKNNFDMTSIIQKDSYEISYYAFKYGTLRAIREFFEGLILPISVIIATLLIIFVEVFFMESHFVYILPFILLFLAICMGIFSLQLRKKYTNMAIKNLYSDFSIAQLHAIEIISQKGHKDSYKHLARVYKNTDDIALKKHIIKAFSHLGDLRAAGLLCKVLKEDPNSSLHFHVLKALYKMGRSLKRTKNHIRIRGFVANELSRFISTENNDKLRALTVKVISKYNPEALVSYLSFNKSPSVQAEAATCLWKMNLHKKKISDMIEKLLSTNKKEDLLMLVYMIPKIKIFRLAKTLEHYIDSDDNELRLVSYTGLIKMRRYEHIKNLINLLLYGNEVILKKGIELIASMDSIIKRKIVQTLMPLDSFDLSLSTESEKEVFNRIKLLYEVCDVYDEKVYLKTLTPKIQEA
jgi:MFS family permease